MSRIEVVVDMLFIIVLGCLVSVVIIVIIVKVII